MKHPQEGATHRGFNTPKKFEPKYLKNLAVTFYKNPRTVRGGYPLSIILGKLTFKMPKNIRVPKSKFWLGDMTPKWGDPPLSG